MAPSKYTDEEKMLLDQFKVLRKVKKEVQEARLQVVNRKKAKLERQQKQSSSNLNASNQVKKAPSSGTMQSFAMISTMRNNRDILSKVTTTHKQAAANTEAAKKLLAAGLLKLGEEKKTTFKPSSRAKKRLNSDNPKRVIRPIVPDDGPGDAPPVDKQRSASVSLTPQPSSDSLPSPPPPGSDAAGDRSDNSQRFKKKIFNKFSGFNSRGYGPKRTGNTIYVYWPAEITHKQLEEEFSKFGNIIDAKLKPSPKGVSGFISYDTFEAAEKSIKDMNEMPIGDWRLKVMIARNQPLLAVAKKKWKQLSMNVDRSENGKNAGETRDLIVYDDADCF